MRFSRIGLPFAGLGAVALSLATFGAPASAAPSAINLAGAQEGVSGPTASVSTTILVPGIETCPALATFQAILAGAVISAAAGDSGGGVALICANGVASYVAVTQVVGVSTPQPNAVSASDLVSVQTSVSATATTVTMRDLSKGWSVTESGGGATPTAAGIGVIAANCQAGLCSSVPAFGAAAFIGSFNGHSLAGSQQTKLLAGNGTPEATPSKAILNQGFTVAYNSSCTPADPSTNNRC